MIDEYPDARRRRRLRRRATTRMRGLQELRVKESDRLRRSPPGSTPPASTHAIEGDDLIVHGTRRPGARAAAPSPTHLDHRIAMSFLVMGLASREADARSTTARMIATSFPGFMPLMTRARGASSRDGERGRRHDHRDRRPGRLGQGHAGAPAGARTTACRISTPACSTAPSAARAARFRPPADRRDGGRARRAGARSRRTSTRRACAAARWARRPPSSRPSRPCARRWSTASAPSPRRPGGAVLDGRDIGTVICPDADGEDLRHRDAGGARPRAASASWPGAART